MSYFMKTLVMEAEFFPADGRMDGRSDRLDETNTRFSQFCGRPPKARDCLGTSFLRNQHKRVPLCC
jgi:hypothetical protein